MIFTIIINKEEIMATRDCKSLFEKRLNIFIEEEWIKGRIVEILNLKPYNKPGDLYEYYDIEYRTQQDPEYLQIEERLKIGL